MPVCPDAKGHEIISPEEKAKLEGKAHETATEVRLHHNHGAAAVDWTASCAAAQEEHVQKLIESLRHKCSIYTKNSTSMNDLDVTRSWKKIWWGSVSFSYLHSCNTFTEFFPHLVYPKVIKG